MPLRDPARGPPWSRSIRAPGRRLPEDRRMADLARQRTHQRRFARHADWGPCDAHGDAVTDPRRVRVPVRPAHPREIGAVARRRLSSQALHEGDLGRVTVLVERVNIWTQL